MGPDLLKSVFLPLSLAIVLFGMGMSLTLADFQRVFRSPKASAAGLLCQFIVLPLAALGVIWLFGLGGEIAVGLLLLSACPGGPTSNLITHLSKGDTALSVTLTAFSSVVAVFTLPLIVGQALNHFLGNAAEIQLPFLRTLAQLFTINILPILLGMWVRAARPAFADRMTRPANIISLVFLVIIIFLVFIREKNLPAQFRLAGPSVVCLNLSVMTFSYLIAAFFGLARPQRITISIEAGIQNGTLAMAIALGLLQSASIAIPAAVYSLFMFISGALMIFRFGWWENARAARRNVV